MLKIITGFNLFMFAVIAAVPALAALQPAPLPRDPNAPFKQLEEIFDFIDNVTGWIARAFWFAAVVAVFYAGYIFLTSGGNEEKTKKAKQVLWYAVIAIVIGLFAFGLPRLILNLLRPGGALPPGGGRV